MSLLSSPKNPITFVPAHAGETIQLGHSLTGRIMEDGTNTDNRLGMIELTLAPHASGPVAHWHEMHDETFLVTKGTVRFHGAGVKDVERKSSSVGVDVIAERNKSGGGGGGKVEEGEKNNNKDEIEEGEGEEEEGVHLDAKEGDYIVIGTRAPHTFSNPTGEEAKFVNTLTPAFYVNYFKMMAEMMKVCTDSFPLLSSPLLSSLIYPSFIPLSFHFISSHSIQFHHQQ